MILMIAVRRGMWQRPGLAVLLGLCWTLLAVQSERVDRWPAAADGERVLAEVEFPELATNTADGWQSVVRWRNLRTAASQSRWYRARLTAANSVLRPPLPGARWQLVLELRAPRAAMNPGGIDSERLQFARRWHALARVRPSSLNKLLQPAQGAWIERARLGLRDRVAQHGIDRDVDALFLALAAGLTDGFSDADWQIFNATGTTHLVAISGTHVTGLAALIYWLARLGWGVLPRSGCRVTRERFAATVAWLVAAAYALFAGFSVPTQRTLLMLSVWYVARCSGRSVGAARTMMLALLAVLLLDPLAPLTSGFWLSFVAMAVLLWLFPGGQLNRQLGARSSAREYVRAQWGITVALAPLTALLFSTVPLAGLWVNALAIPLFALLLVPLCLLASVLLFAWPPVGEWLLQLFATVHWPIGAGLAWAAASPWALWRLPDGTLAAVALMILALSWLPPWPLRLRMAGTLAAVMGLVGAFWWAFVSAPRACVTMLDSGMAGSVVLRAAGRAAVVDTGDGWRSRGRATVTHLLPMLRARGVEHIDLLVLGRPSTDRAQGLAWLTNALSAGAVIGSSHWRSGPLPVMACDRRTLHWGGVGLQLWPAGDACALRVLVAGQSWWLAHTLNARDESALLMQLAAAGVSSADLLILRRGAANAGLANPLWRALQPTMVWTSGAAPRRRVPVGATEIFRTSQHGALELCLNRGGRSNLRRWRVDSGSWAWRDESTGS